MAQEQQIFRQPNCALPKIFFEGRLPVLFHPESVDYDAAWTEEIRRCKEGFSYGGFSVTGAYYYHLNHKKINLLDEGNRPLIEHPFYSEEDQQLFNDIERARQLMKGIMLITGRGFGKSFSVASIVEHWFTFFEATESIVSSSVALYADELWAKIELGLNSQPDELRASLLVDKTTEKLSGNKVTVAGKIKKIGFLSKMRKVIYDNDAGRTRGTRPGIHVFEEVGAWTGAAKLEDCISQTEASWWRGSIFTCLPILIGTGGMMKSGGSKDAKKIGLDPDSHNLLSFEYNGRKTCKFYPAYMKYGGYYEDSGASDQVGAKVDLDKRRDKLKGNIALYRQFCQEQPYDIDEAFEESGGSNFTQEYLENQFNYIMRTPSAQKMVFRGNLIPIRVGEKIVDVKMVEDEKGDFEFLRTELPRRDENGRVIPNLYIAGIDSFDASEEEVRPDLSPGCMRVFKRFWKAGETGRIFVAGITLRTKNGFEFYQKTALLNMYFGCKSLYEHTNKGISQWYITNGLAEKYLYLRPILDGIIKNSKSSNRYGIVMPIQVKSAMINRYSQFIDENEGENVKNMFFLPQLKDHMDFRFGSKEHHETMASGLCLLADDDMHNLIIKETQKKTQHFPKFVRDRHGNLVFT